MLIFQRAWVAVSRGLFYGICFSTLATSAGWGQIFPDQQLEKYQENKTVEDDPPHLYQSYQNIEIPTPQGTVSLPAFLSSIPHEAAKTSPQSKFTLLKEKNSESGPSEPLTVVAAINSRNAILRFDWGEKDPALAVVKGVGRWWIVFDEYKPLSLPDIEHNPLPGILNLETIPTEDGLVIQLIAHSDFTPVVSREGNTWQISLQTQVLPVAQIASVELPQTKEDSLVVEKGAWKRGAFYRSIYRLFLCYFSFP